MVTRDEVVWAYRLFLLREPESEEVILDKLDIPSATTLVNAMMGSAEFRSKHRQLVEPIDRWVMIEHPLGFKLWVNLADVAISWGILQNNFENGEISFCKNHILPDYNVLDIGTNIGFFSMLFSTLVGSNGRVIGFEPLPFLHDAAVKSVRENGFHQCTIHNAAIAAERATAQLVYSPDTTNWGGAFLSFDGSVLPGHTSVSVPVSPLTDFVGDIKANFIKIDVEGAEYLVMSAILDYLEAYRPVIMSEVHTKQLRRVSNVSAGEYIALLKKIGYNCYELGHDGNIGGVLSGDEDITLTNVAFIFD